MEELKKYKEAVDALKKYKDEHAEVVSEIQQMEERIGELSDIIKAVVKKTGEDEQYENISVKIIRKFKKWYDPAQLCEETIKCLRVEGAIEMTVNKEIFESMVEKTIITKEEKQKAYCEQELSPAVSIKVS